MPSLTVVITTNNAAATLERTLASVKFADEIIIIDDSSTDRTADIAQRFSVRFLTHAWTGYGPQKNYGLAKASSDWILFVDADEVIPPSLAQQIQTVIATPQHHYYWLRLITIFLGRPLPHLSGHNLRLIKKEKAHWNSAPVHEQMVRLTPLASTTINLHDPDTDVIIEPVIHYSHPTIRSYLKKMHYYTTLDAEQIFNTGRHRSGRSVKPSFLLPYSLAGRQLSKLLFYRRGFLDGLPGIIWCVLSAYYEYEMGQKYLKLIQRP